uniref:hypothetical protein n=1 Tax=Arthrobacter sp. S2(2024) TaxID=3111911 RepID=UPI002FCCA638
AFSAFEVAFISCSWKRARSTSLWKNYTASNQPIPRMRVGAGKLLLAMFVRGFMIVTLRIVKEYKAPWARCNVVPQPWKRAARGGFQLNLM